MLSSNFTGIRNLLFDLGGVIINTNPQKTAQAFGRRWGRSAAEAETHLRSLEAFARYEGGEWDDRAFRKLVGESLGQELTETEFEQDWNAMLLDIPPERVELLRRLRSNYRLYLLSNTNPIHLREVNAILQRSTGVLNLEELFDKTYYSFQLKLSKPDPATYQHVLTDAGLQAEETLFIDDHEPNIISANQMGLRTVHLRAPRTLLDVFANA